ncbi:hypothetical protein [Burkholderia ambifaria]|uniref:Large ATP-binding protein n=1 Tax=Burkholderia ambifaria MEX-5 TaxID=396597 RepID=B1T1U9_9BURK|nr:hypothetical protein [Burkholderia ambifaria]EDT42476.1 conserved hypothetical protein [Burkholderia ambifaria MEX-5]
MRDNTDTRKAFSPLKSAVAERAGVPLATVESLFAEAKVSEEVGTRQAEHLTIRRLMFSGVKRATDSGDGPFRFEWSNLDTGLWLVLSDDQNQVGKSTILEVMLWALRGRMRNLRPEVRAWIERVEFEFSIGLDHYLVQFDDGEGGAAGELVRIAPGPAQILSVFGSDEGFEHAMGELMMKRFALQAIPIVNKQSENAEQIHHTWTLYAASLFIEGSHRAILGDVLVGALWWRMLHLFVGMPYSGAHMALRSAVTLTALRLDKLRGGTSRALSVRQDIGRLEARISELQAELEASSLTMPHGADVEEVLKKYMHETVSSANLGHSVAELDAQFTATSAQVNEARADLRRLQDGSAAKRIFAGLNPVCCPRCAKPFPAERMKGEEDEGNCAVCARDTLTDDRDAVEAAIADAQERIETAIAARDELKVQVTERKAERDAALARGDALAQNLRDIEARASEYQRQQAKRFELERAYGALEQLKALAAENTVSAPTEELAEQLKILEIAEQIAEERLKLSGAELLRQLETELVTVATRVGFRGLEEVAIRGNGITLQVSGTPSSFGKQTPGQRLRLRISLVIAMMKLAGESGQGHHPGLLFIDSPGSEELSEADLGAMMSEIRSLAAETQNLQIFVSSARGASLAGVVSRDQQIWPKSGAAMF